MIHNGDELETGVVRRAGHRGQVRAEPRGAGRGGEIGYLQANLHAPPPPMRLSYPGPRPWPGTGRFTDSLSAMASSPGARDRPGPGPLPHPVTQNGEMSAPVLKAETLVTTDGVPIDAIHLPGG